MFPWKYTGTFDLCCSCKDAAEQKARATYDNILRLSDDPDVNDVIRFLREREVVHYQRFGEANHTNLRKNFYKYQLRFHFCNI